MTHMITVKPHFITLDAGSKLQEMTKIRILRSDFTLLLLERFRVTQPFLTQMLGFPYYSFQEAST